EPPNRRTAEPQNCRTAEPQNQLARRFSAGNARTAEPRIYNQQSGVLLPLIAGLALGQWALVRIEFFLVIAPALVFLLYIWLSGRWERAHGIFALALGAMLLQAALHVTFIARGYFFDTLWARLQDRSAIVAALSLPFLNASIREVYLTTPRSLVNYLAADPAIRTSPLRLFAEVVLLIGAVIGLVLLRRWPEPLRWFEAWLLRAGGALRTATALLVVLACVYAYLVRPQILTPQVLAAAPSCLAPTQLRQPSGPCLALQSYIGAPLPLPERPDWIAYAVDSLLKLPRQPRLPNQAEVVPAQPVAVRDLPTLEGRPSPGVSLDQIAAGERTHVLGKSQDGISLLVRSLRGVVGWIDQAGLPLDQAAVAALPQQPDRILARLINPRWATPLSPGNPSESAKFALYQGSMVRFGWYLSPLGVALAAAGLALLWQRVDRESWMLLVIGSALTYTFIEQAYGTDEATYIYLLRRFVPVSYPLFALSAAYALVELARFFATKTRRYEGRVERTARSFSNLRAFVPSWLSILLSGTLVVFLVATNAKLYRHTEYAGAIAQFAQIAQKFERNSIILLRGGAPTHGEFRDLPDIIATPLTYGFARHALTVKSQQPGRYAADLARYIQYWQSQGRPVYLVQSASGALPFPNLRQEKIDTLQLSIEEFEQLVNQKPSNAYTLTLDYAVYRLLPGDAADLPRALTPFDYGSQVRGLFRPELFAGQPLAWTNGDALLRLPWPAEDRPFQVQVRLRPGPRPTALGPVEACLSYRGEASFWLEDPQATPFSQPNCSRLNQGENTLTLNIDPQDTPAPATGTFLLRIESPTWVPARDQPGSNDGRALGVLFGGAQLQAP
ncbi:MAG: hypothetical protein H7Z42_03270, partial [Roseiflexaceae bacterium]|nr:hypothetical protein [Roseiflexaceae bacterium]